MVSIGANRYMKYPFNLLTEYFVRENHIDTSKQYEIVKLSARDLICTNRFDLLAKWIYIDAKEKKLNMDWATKVYFDNINAFSCGTFLEPGTDEKDSFQKYLNDFNSLIEDIKSNGFNSAKSLVPVGENNILLDGSHRVAVAAYFAKDITVIKFPNLTRQYDYRYFRKYLMSDINMGYMASQYAHLKKKCYMACLWPVADLEKSNEVEEELKKVGNIIYSQDVYLNREGMKNFMVQIYGHQGWTGNIENHFQGVYAKVDACYRKGQAVRTYLFEADNLEIVVETKKKIRDIFGLENHSIHISDTQEETEAMVNLLYNNNSVSFLNFAEADRYSSVWSALKNIKMKLVEKGYEADRFLVVSDTVLEVYGLRENEEICMITDYSAKICDEVIKKCKFDGSVKLQAVETSNSLFNPENYIFVNGMKVLSITRLQEYLQQFNNTECASDIVLCQEFLKREKKVPRKNRISVREHILQYQKDNKDYGHGCYTLREYYKVRIKACLNKILYPYFVLRHVLSFSHIVEKRREIYLNQKRNKLKNKSLSIISSNCNGGVVCSDLDLPFNSPFVNLFIKAEDYIKILRDLKGYMKSELQFVKEEDPIYGNVNYPTAYLKDAKIYFMHYKSDEEALTAWNRRKERINWDNLYVIFTDRSGCTQADLEAFDKLPYKHKVVFTHIPHPEIESSFYIRGYENEKKVGILSEYQNEKYPCRRQLDQFDFVRWFNET